MRLDILGLLNPSFPYRFQYVSTFLDDHSQYVRIGLIYRSSVLGDSFYGASARLCRPGGANVTVKFCGSIAMVHLYCSKDYVDLKKDLGGGVINKSFFPPYTPELNSIAERVNRSMAEAARSFLIQADSPHCLSPFALKHVIPVRNRVPYSTIGTTQFFLITSDRSSLKNEHVVGCTSYMLLPRGPKFEYRALEGVYLDTLKDGAYNVLGAKGEPPRVSDSRNVTFN